MHELSEVSLKKGHRRLKQNAVVNLFCTKAFPPDMQTSGFIFKSCLKNTIARRHIA